MKQASALAVRRENDIKWMLSSSNPNPLAFFRRVFPTHRNRAFDTYSRTLGSALRLCEDEVVRARLLKMKEKLNVCIEYAFH